MLTAAPHLRSPRRALGAPGAQPHACGGPKTNLAVPSSPRLMHTACTSRASGKGHGKARRRGRGGAPVALAKQELAAVDLARVAGVHAQPVRVPRVELALVPGARARRQHERSARARPGKASDGRA